MVKTCRKQQSRWEQLACATDAETATIKKDNVWTCVEDIIGVHTDIQTDERYREGLAMGHECDRQTQNCTYRGKIDERTDRHTDMYGDKVHTNVTDRRIHSCI